MEYLIIYLIGVILCTPLFLYGMYWEGGNYFRHDDWPIYAAFATLFALLWPALLPLVLVARFSAKLVKFLVRA